MFGRDFLKLFYNETIFVTSKNWNHYFSTKKYDFCCFFLFRLGIDQYLEEKHLPDPTPIIIQTLWKNESKSYSYNFFAIT